MGSKVAFYGTVTAAVVTLAHLLHGVGHLGHGVPLTFWQWVYTMTVIFAATIVAAALLWSSFAKTGAWLFSVSMAGCIVFGVAYHYLVPGPDNVSTLEPGVWRLPFEATAALGALSEVLGVAVGIWAVSNAMRRGPKAGRR